MVSRIITRPWLRPVVCNRSSASVTMATAVSKPKLRSVCARSLSIVFGQPTMGTPFDASWCAMAMLPSPPMTTIASSPSSRT